MVGRALGSRGLGSDGQVHPGRVRWAGVRLEIDERVDGVEPERALAWWTDFRSGEHDHGFVPGARRGILEDGPEGTLIADEVRWFGLPVFRERVRARVRGNTVQLDGENTFARFQGRYRFEHVFEPEGTRVVLAARIHLKGPLRWLERLGRPLIRTVLRWDTRKHLEQMAEETRSPATAGRRPPEDAR